MIEARLLVVQPWRNLNNAEYALFPSSMHTMSCLDAYARRILYFLLLIGLSSSTFSARAVGGHAAYKRMNKSLFFIQLASKFERMISHRIKEFLSVLVESHGRSFRYDENRL